jgi:hypothetical protein
MAFLALFFTVVLSLCVLGLCYIALVAILRGLPPGRLLIGTAPRLNACRKWVPPLREFQKITPTSHFQETAKAV